MVESEIARGFLRQRAWIEAEAELRRHTEIDRNDVMEMRGRGMSFDAIAAVYGCSHETIAKIAANGAAPRKRARLVGYVAKSRLRLSEWVSCRSTDVLGCAVVGKNCTRATISCLFAMPRYTRLTTVSRTYLAVAQTQ